MVSKVFNFDPSIFGSITLLGVRLANALRTLRKLHMYDYRPLGKYFDEDSIINDGGQYYRTLFERIHAS